MPVPARGAAPGCSPAGLLPSPAPGARLPPAIVGLGQSRRVPKAVSDLLLEQPFPGHLPACPKSTVLCDLLAGRTLLGAREAAVAPGRRWGKLSPDVGSGRARVGWGVGARGLTQPGSEDVSAWVGVPQRWALGAFLPLGLGEKKPKLRHLPKDLGSAAHRQLSWVPHSLRAMGTLSWAQEQMSLGPWTPLTCCFSHAGVQELMCEPGPRGMGKDAKDSVSFIF